MRGYLGRLGLLLLLICAVPLLMAQVPRPPGGSAAAPGSLPPYAVGDTLYANTTTSLAKLAAVATGQLYASAGLNTAPGWSASPTLTTSLTDPLLIGGTAVDSTLTLKATTGVGTTGSDIIMQTGTNGAVENLRVSKLTGGISVGGISSPQSRMHLVGGPVIIGSTLTDNTLKFSSQGTTLASQGGITSIVFNDAAGNRPEIEWIRGSRTYPEFAIREHTTADKGGEVYAGPGTAQPTLVLGILSTGLGILTTTPTTALSLDGQAARTFWMERQTTAATAGNPLTVQAGGAKSAGTDLAGGTLNLTPGAPTGTGRSLVSVQGHVPADSTGTGDGTAIDREIVGAYKALTNNSATSIVNMTVASNTVVAAVMRYAVQVYNGTDLQVEEGILSCHATNKAASVANNTCVKSANQQAVTSGTLVVTGAISAASPAVISVNANSSLTPSAGYPRLTYSLSNLTSQAVSVQ